MKISTRTARVPHVSLLRHGILTLALPLTLALTGCTVGPKYTRPVVPAPPAFRGADDASISSETSIADQQWSAVFKEPELQALIKTALANNYDLRIAAQRILEQQAQVQVTRSQEFPQITAGGQGIGASFNASALGAGNNSGTNTGSTSNGITSPISFGSFSLGATWTPDFWGLYRRQTEAARANLLAQTWAQNAVRLTLVQNVATTYIQLRALDAQLAISKQPSRPARTPSSSPRRSKPAAQPPSRTSARPSSSSTPPAPRSRSSSSRSSSRRTP